MKRTTSASAPAEAAAAPSGAASDPAPAPEPVPSAAAVPGVRRVSAARLPTRHGEFTTYVYEATFDGAEHVALVAGDVAQRKGVLVRLHSECLTGDVFASLRCDCGEQLAQALDKVTAEGCGVVLYLRGHEGRGIGLANKIRAYALQDEGRDTVDANQALGLPVDARRYEAGIAILRDLGISSVRLMSNNPRKFKALEEHGIEVVGRVPLTVEPNPENRGYLETKQRRLGHYLENEY